MNALLKKIIRSLFPLSWILPISNFIARLRWHFRGIDVISSHDLFRIIKGNKEIRLSSTHQIYLQDTLMNFDFYFEGVTPSVARGMHIVDYSKPAWHDVIGFELMPVFFNSVAEPVITTNQYLEFASLQNGSVAIDLGAYSALTSIMMDQKTGEDGLVIAVEADRDNFITCLKNLSLYEKMTTRKIQVINGAIWNHSSGIMFSSEGSMGSSVVDIAGKERGENILVDTVTLMSLVAKFELKRVDFIKCDIEGAEAVALDSPEFFSKFRPRVVIECHFVGGISTETACVTLMEGFGYQCELREQYGYPLPLLFCTPS